MIEFSKWHFFKKTKAYHKASQFAESLTMDSQGLSDLISKVSEKVKAIEESNIQSLLDSLATCLRMVKAYASGQYRDLSSKSISLIVVSLVYFLFPLDGIADFIPGLGYADDTALLLWTLKAVSEDVNKFLEWEANNKANCNKSLNTLKSL